jgi:hypothetical protein
MTAARYLVLGLLIPLAAPVHGSVSSAVSAYIERTFDHSNYKRADADLNGDGRPETFIYAIGPKPCGSGGCSLVIISPHGKSLDVVLRSSVTQLPIRLLSTSTRGWRDVGVTVAGGGITRAYMARLRFNGRRYPSNPTVPPAVHTARPSGRVLISE